MPRRELLLESCEDRILCDAAPDVTLNVPTNVKIGDTVQVTATFDNTSPTDTGFGPYIDLVLKATGADGAGAETDDGVTFLSATYLGQPVKATVLTFDALKQAIHPYAKDATGNPVVVTAPPGYEEGDQLVVLQLPFGSFAADQPPAAVTINLKTSNLADAGKPLAIAARGGFQYGNDALSNPTTDPSIIDPAYAEATITPTLFTLTKTYLGPEDETATGPNFLRQYRLDIDVADGQTITNLDINDLLPNSMQFTRLVSATPGGALVTPAPSTTTPGGTFTYRFNSVTGAAGVDASVTIEFFVPRINSGTAVIINAATGDDVTMENNASASGTWDPIDSRDALTTVTVDRSGPEHVLTAKSIATQKSVRIVTDTGAAGVTPGDTLEYTIQVQVSDYFAFQNLTLTDLFSDGQRFDTSFAPTLEWSEHASPFSAAAFGSTNYSVTLHADNNPATPATDGSTTVFFDVSNEMIRRGADGKLLGGGLPDGGTGAGTLPNNPPSIPFGPTTVTIKFRTIVQDAFSDTYPSGDASLNPGDALTNSVTVSGDLLQVGNVTTPTNQSEADTSGTTVRVVNPTVSKSIYAINGSTTLPLSPTGAVLIRPGDTVTYRLQYTIPTGDAENLKLNDYLPQPIFNATQVTTFSTAAPSAAAPPAGTAKWGPSETFRLVSGSPTPTITTNAGNNLLTFSYPAQVDDTTNTPRVVDILFTVTVGSQPFADGLFLTNQVQVSENNTQQPATAITSNAIVQVQLQEPNVALTKGVVGYEGTGLTLGGITFQAPSAGTGFSGGIVNNETQATAIGDSNLLNGEVDTGDLVRFALVVQNTGRNDAYDVRFGDQILNPGFNLPAGATSEARLSSINFTLRRGDGTLLVRGTDLNNPGVDYVATLSASGALTVELADHFTSGNTTGDTGVGGLSRGFNASTNATVTNGSNTIVATYDLTLAPGVANLGATLTNTATLTNYAAAEGTTDFTTEDQTDDASVKLPQPTLGKSFVSTSVVESGNSNTQAVIGELVTYTLTVHLPEGSMTNARIIDTLDAGMAFVGVNSVVSSAGVTMSTPIGTGTTPANVVVGTGGQLLTFNFGTITNANTSNTTADTITITYTAVVLNTNTAPSAPGNQSGTALNNSATLSGQYTDLPTGTATSYSSAQTAPTANVTIVEPAVTASNSLSTDNVTYVDNGTVTAVASQTVYYKVVLTNTSSVWAHDISFYDRLPTVFSIPNTSIMSVTSSLGAGSQFDTNSSGGFANFMIGPDNAFGNLKPVLATTGALASLAPGETLTIIVRSTVVDNAASASTHPNNLQVRWTSIDDNVRSGDAVDTTPTGTTFQGNSTPIVRSIYNSASVERTGADGPPINSPTDSLPLNNYAVNDPVSSVLEVLPVSIVKLLQSTEINTSTNGATQAVVGELATYSVTFAIPKGTTSNFVLTDLLDAGLAFVDLVGVTTGPDVVTNVDASGNPTGASISDANTPAQNLARLIGSTAVTSNGTRIVINLGNVQNNQTPPAPGDFVPPQEITIIYRAVVTNVAANQAGQTRNNVATIDYDTTADSNPIHIQRSDTPASPVSIIEPALTVAKDVGKSGAGPFSDSLAGFDAGDPVFYRITITNAPGGATAFDMLLNDALPSQFSGASVFSVTGGGLTTSDFTISGGNLTTTSASGVDIAGGSTITIIVSGTLSVAVNPGQTITNTANISWTSIDGTPGVRSTYNTDSTERTGANGVPTDSPNNTLPLNNYAATDSAQLSTLVTTNVKSIVATSESFTTLVSGTERVAVGEIVRYRLQVQVPEGTLPNLQLLDFLPTGLVFINDGTAMVGFVSNGNKISSNTLTTGALDLGATIIQPTRALGDNDVSTSATANSDNYDNGTDVRFKLGTIVNSDTDNSTAEYIIVEFNALVLNTTANQSTSSTPLANSFDTQINGTTKVGSTSNIVNVAVAEPNLTVAMTPSTTGPVDAGDTFTYTIRVTNNASGVNSAPAFDVRVLDLVDQLVAGTNPSVDIEYDSYTLSTAGSSTVITNASTPEALDLTLNRLDVGVFVDIVVTVKVKAGAFAGAEIENKAVVTYSSLPGASGTETGAIATQYGTTDVDLNPGTDSVLANADANNGTINLGVNAGERTGVDVSNPTDNSAPGVNTTRNNYAVAAIAPGGASAITVRIPTIDKQYKDGSLSEDDTSVASSTNSTVVIGETVTYDLLVTLPEGVTQDLRVQDFIPAGLRVDSIEILTAAGTSSLLTDNFAGSFATTPTLGAPVNGAATMTLDFDNVTVLGDNNANNNRFVIRVVATVTNILPNQQNVTLTAGAQLLFNDPDGSGNAGPAADLTIADSNAANNPTVTIAEPTVTVNKTKVETPPVDAGGTIDYTITLTNTSGQTAYEVTLSDAIDTNLVVTAGFIGSVPGSSVTATGGASVSGSAFEIVNLGGGTYVLRSAAGADVDLPTGGQITIHYSATIGATAPAAGTITNTANIRWSSLDGGLDGTAAGTLNERTGSGISDPAPATINQASTVGPLNNYALSSSVVTTAINNISAVKTLVTTSLNGADGLVTPGEIVTYQISVTLPEGVAPDLQIRDVIPPGMAYISGSLVMNTTGYAGSVLPPAANPETGASFQSGTGVIFDFASITTTDDNVTTNNTFTFTYQVVVLDVASNDGILPGQQTLPNTAAHNNGSGTTFSTSAGGATVTVTEPNLTVTNNLSVTGVKDAGAPFTYTITVASTANATSGAYEVRLSDILPAELGNLTIASAIISDGATNTNVAGNFTIVGNTLSTTGSIALLLNTNGTTDQVLTLTITGNLSSAINPGETVNMLTSLAYTSHPGDRTSPAFDPSTAVTTDHERSYTASDTESFVTPNASFSKSLFGTSQPFTSGTNVAIGETVTYALLVTLPEGTTPDLTILDRLPNGLQYLSATVITTAAASGGLLAADFNGTVPLPAVSGSATDGADVTFTFGAISATGDNVASNNSFLVLLTARVTNTLANQSGTVLGNDAQFDISTDSSSVFTTPAVNVTVVEPRVTVTKSVTSAITGLDAGDTVTYQVVLDNLSANGATADAFDVSLSDVLPAGMIITSIGTPTLNGAATVDTALGGTGTGTLTGIFDIPLGGSVTFTYTARLEDTVTPNQTLASDLNVAFSSLNGADDHERTGADVANPEDNTPPASNSPLNNYAVGSDVSFTTVQPFSVSKALIDSSLGNDTSLNVVIGETLTYQLSVSVMEGTTNNLSIVDTLPRVGGVNQLTYIPGSFTVTNANGVTINGLSATYSAATNQLTITAGSIVNPGNTDNAAATDTDTFTITYQVQVANVAQNQSGTNLTNDADASATSVPPDNDNQVTVVVREPVLTLDKTTTTPGTDAGDTVIYTLVIANTGNATAYDINIQDALDAALRLATPGSALTITSNPGYASLAQGGNTATAVDSILNRLQAGDSVTITITAQVAGNAPAGDTVSNTATVTYSSLPGTPAGERNGSGGVNDYTVADASTDFTLARPAIDKLTPADTTYSIGETVTYDILVTLPEGTTNDLVITDNLPAGLVFTGFQVVTTSTGSGGLLSADFNGTIGVPTLGNPSGNIRTFNFGSVVSTGDNVASNNTFLLRVSARVANISANQGAGSPGVATQFSNNATLQYTDATTGAATVTDPTAPGAITVVEPIMSFDKQVLSSTAGLDAGDIVQYQITIGNTGTATAHDVNLADLLPPGFIITGGSLNPGAGVTVDSSSGGVGSNFLNYQFTIPVGGTITLTYTVRLPDTVTPGSSHTNSATLNWSSVDGADPNERTGSDGTQNGGTLNDYSLSDSETVTIANPFSVTKSLIETSLGNDASTDVVVGEVLTYQLAVTVMEGTTNSLTLLDTLPPGVEFVPGSVGISNANGIIVSNYAVNYNAGSNLLTMTAATVVNPGGSNSTTNDASAVETDTFYLTYQVRVLNVAGNQSGTELTNEVDGSATGVSPDNDNRVTVTVREPVLTLDKTTTTSGTDAGDTVIYTLVITNTGDAAAYDINIHDALDAALRLATPGSALAITSNPGYASLTQSGNTATAVHSVLNGLRAGDSVTITITAQVEAGASAGDTISNTATVTYSSLPGTQAGERDGSGGINDYTVTDASTDFTLATPTIDKLTPTDTTYAIGETVTYDIVVTLPEGTTNDLVITDHLPAGLVYTNFQVVTSAAASGGLLAADFGGTPGIPAVGNPSGNIRTFNFGNVLTTGDNNTGNNTFILRVTARVDNILANQGAGSPAAATTFSNTATLQYTDGTTGSETITDPTAPDAITVVEPIMSLDKSTTSPTTNLDAGDSVQFQIVFSNTGTSTAHEVTLADVLPPGVLISSIDSVTLSGGATIDLAVSGIGTGNLSGTFTVPVGGQVIINYTVVLQSNVAPGATLTNTASISWSSVDGAVAGERDGSDGTQSDGTVNDYRLNDSVTFTTDTTLLFSKSLVSTSQASSIGQDVVVGETATFELKTTLQQGVTRAVIVRDSLPGGLQYVTGSAVFRAVTAGSTAKGQVSGTLYEDGDAIDAADLVYDSGTGSLTFSFVDVTVVASPAVGTGDFAVEYDALVLDILANTNGTTLQNTASVSADRNNDGDTVDASETTATQSVMLTVKEPLLVVAKSNNDPDAIVTQGETITYTLTVANNGTATAFDVLLRDVIPAGLLYVPGSATFVSGVAPDAASLNVAGTTLSATFASLAVGESSTITFKAVVQTSGSLENNVRVFYDSLPADEATNSVAAQTPDGTPDRDYGADGGLNGTVEAPGADTDPAQATNLVTLGTGIIGDRVWFDLNGDGLQGANEPGLAGVTVTLLGINPDSTTFTLTTQTDANGNYLFTHLAPTLGAETYKITVVSSTLPDGAAIVPTYDLDGTGTPHNTTLTLGNGQTRDDVDFGYRGTGTLGDLVWLDRDANGVRAATELGIASVTLDLIWDVNGNGLVDSGESVLATTTTNGQGTYSFGDLLVGKYVVRVTDTNNVLTGATQTYDLDGLTTANLAGTTLTSAGQNRTDTDFGYRGDATISGVSYHDRLKDGSLNGTDTGIGGVTIQAVWDQNNNGIDAEDSILSVVTAADGTFAFDHLLAGNYYVLETQPAGFGQGTQNGTDQVAINLPTASTLTSGANFGNTTGSLAGRVYSDLTNNGVEDGADTGLAGVSVTLQWSGADGVFGNGDDRSVTVQTDANGNYRFDYANTAGFLTGFGNTTGGLLSTGAYRLTEITPEKFVDGAETAGNAATNAGGVDEGTDPGFAGRGGTDQIGIPGNEIQIGAGQDATGYAFAELPASSISGVVYVDISGDGTRQGDEPGIPGVKITLTGVDDLGHRVTRITTTDGRGAFKFDMLRPGKYQLIETQPPGYNDGKDRPGTAGGAATGNDRIVSIELTPGKDAIAYYFGETPIPLPPAPIVEAPVRPTGPVFAYDSFHNFANTSTNAPEAARGISPIDIWRAPLLPIAPIYSGTANPGATLVIDIYNANGVHLGSRTVLADSGGNWLANFQGIVLRDTPTSVRISQTNATYSFGTDAGTNLRTYYSPTLLSPGQFVMQEVNRHSSDEEAPLLGGLDLSNPLQLGVEKYGGEFLSSAGIPTGR